MGNESPKIQKYINEELKIKKLVFEDKDEIELKQVCSPYFYNQQDFIIENKFKYLIQFSEQEIFDIIFNIFARTYENINEKILTYEDIKYLYCCFKISNPKIKIILIVFLLFENNNIIKSIEFNNHIFKIFKKDFEMQAYLSNYFAEYEEENYKLKNVINKLSENSENIDFLTKFKFIKKLDGSSKYKIQLINKNEDFNYICDCAKLLAEENIENNLDTMKNSYDSLTRNTNNIFYFKDFQILLQKSQIHKKLINLVIEYLRKYTQKDYCCFNDVKYIFTNLNYSLPINDKKKFIFKMILTICEEKNKLTYDQINKYLNIDYNESENNINTEDISYEENDFITNNIFDEMINKINPHLDNFGLLPYLKFNVKAKDKKIKRRLVKDILKNENIDNYEKYLENKFDEYNYFYAIDINFWNILMNENEEAPDYINNSRIAEEVKIIKEEDKIIQEIQKIQQDKEREKNEKKNKKKKEKKEKENKNKDKVKEEYKENK